MLRAPLNIFLFHLHSCITVQLCHCHLAIKSCSPISNVHLSLHSKLSINGLAGLHPETLWRRWWHQIVCESTRLRKSYCWLVIITKLKHAFFVVLASKGEPSKELQISPPPPLVRAVWESTIIFHVCACGLTLDGCATFSRMKEYTHTHTHTPSKGRISEPEVDRTAFSKYLWPMLNLQSHMRLLKVLQR